MAKDNVAISAAMSDKELLASIDKTLKQAEQRFESFSAKAVSSMSAIEKASFTAGTNIGKNLGDGVKQKTGDLLKQLQKVADKAATIGSKVGSGAVLTVNVNELDTAISKAGALNTQFKEMMASTNRIAENLQKMNKARTPSKAAMEEARVTLELEKQKKWMEQAIRYRKQALDIAQRTAREDSRRRITTAGASYDSAMSMSARTIQERMDKMKALQIVQRNLSMDNQKEAQQLRNVNKELAALKKANLEAANAGVELQKKNNKLAESFVNLGKRVLFYTGLGALTGFVRNLVEVRGQYELLERSIGAVLGDFEKGSQIFREQQKLALESPFTVIDLAGATKQLAAYNFAAEDLVDTSRRLADISAALGVPMERLTYNLGQIKAQTVLMARDARDFANAGLPITQELANMYSELEGRVVSVGEVMDRMSNRMVSFGDVMKVINRYTDQGGMFFEFQKKQAQTLAGQLSNLTDAYNNMLNEMGTSSQGFLSGTVSALRSVLEHWEAIVNVLSTLITTYGIYKAVQLVYIALSLKQIAVTVQWGKYLTIARDALRGYTKATAAANAAGEGLNKTLVAIAKNPYGAIIAGLAAAGLVIYKAYQNANKLKRELDGIISTGANTANELAYDFGRLVDKLNNSTKGSRDFGEALKEINSTYGQYLPNLLTEINYTDELAKNYNKVIDSIYNKAKAQSLEKGYQAIEEEFGTQQQEAISSLINQLVGAKLSRRDAQNLVQTFVGSLKDGLQEGESYIGRFNKVSKKFFEGNEAEMQKLIPLYNSFFGKLGDFDKLGKAVEGQKNAIESLRASSDIMNRNATYNSVKEGKALDALEEKYAALEQTEENRIKKLRELQELYKNYDDTENYKIITRELAKYDKQLENWQQNVKDIIAAAPEGVGSAFDVLPDDNSVKYIERLKKSYSDLINQRKLLAGTNTDDATKQRVEDQLAVVMEIGRALKVNFTTQKELNKEENEETKLLKQRLSLIKDISKSNEELVKKTGSLTTAAEKTKEAYQGMFDELLKGKGIKFEDLLTFNSTSFMKVYDELAKGLKSDQAKNALNKQRAEFMIEYSVQVNTASLKSAERAIGNLFQGYELELDVQDAGQFGSLFQSLFDYDPVSLEQLNNDVTAMLEGLEAQISDFNERKGILTNLIENTADPSVVKAYQAELGKMEELESNTAKFITSTRKKLNDTNAKYYADNFKVYQDISKKYADYEDRRAEIEMARQREQAALATEVQRQVSNVDKLKLKLETTTDPDERQKILGEISSLQDFVDTKSLSLSLSIDTKSKQDQAKLDFDVFKESELYQKSFEDMANISTGSLDMLMVALDELKDKVGTSHSPTDMKTFMSTYKQVRDEIQGRDIFGSLVSNTKNWIAATKEASALEKQLKVDQDNLTESNNRLAAAQDAAMADPTDVQAQVELGEAIEKQAEAQKNVVNTTNQLNDTNDDAKKSWEGMAKDISNAANAIDGMNSLLGQVNELLGITEDSEAGQAMQAFSQGLTLVSTALGVAATAMIAFHASMLPVLAAGAAVAAVIGSVLFFTGRRDRSITKQIEESERTVKRLDISYKNLERTIKKSMGSAEIAAQKAAIANQKLQLIELERQLQLEKSRKGKKRDEDKIIELEGQINDLRNEIEDANTAIVDALMGTSVKDAAESMVSDMIDAFRKGEDWMASFGDSFEDMIDNMIMKAIVSKVIGAKLEEMWNEVQARIDARSGQEQDAYQKALANSKKDDSQLMSDLGIPKKTQKHVKDSKDVQAAVAKLREKYLKELEQAEKNLDNSNFLNPSDADFMRDWGKDMTETLKTLFPDMMDKWGIQFGEAAESGLSGLQKGIQNISESTANEILSYLNSLIGQVFQQTTLQQQMVNLMQLNAGTNSQVLLTLRESFQIMSAIRDWTINISTAAGNGIRVQLLE